MISPTILRTTLSNTRDALWGTGTTLPSWAHAFTPGRGGGVGGYIFLVFCVLCVFYYLIRYVSCAKCCECLWMLDRLSLTLICDICCSLFTNGVGEEEERFWPGYIIYKIYNSSILQIKINFICILNILVP